MVAVQQVATPSHPTAAARWSLLLALLVVCSSWGMTYAATKLALHDASPGAFAALRALFGGVSLTVVALVLRRPFPRSWRGQFHVVVLGLTNVAGFIGLLNYGLTGVSAGAASLIIYTQPLWVALLAPMALGERLTRRRVAGLGLGFLGALAVLNPRFGRHQATDWSAYGALLLGAMLWAVGTIYYRRVRNALDPTWAAALQTLYAALPLLAVWGWLEGAAMPHVSWSLIWTVAFTGGVSSGLAYVLWFWMLRQRDATVVGISVYLVPAFAVLFGAILLGERPGLNVAVGGGLVLAGLAVTRRA